MRYCSPNRTAHPKEAAWLTLTLNSGQRLRIYESLSRLNRSFTCITCRLFEVDDTGFHLKRLKELRGSHENFKPKPTIILSKTLRE